MNKENIGYFGFTLQPHWKNLKFLRVNIIKTVLILTFISFFSTQVIANELSLEKRIEKLEKLLKSKPNNIEQLDQIENLYFEIQQLRAQLNTQQNIIENLKNYNYSKKDTTVFDYNKKQSNNSEVCNIDEIKNNAQEKNNSQERLTKDNTLLESDIKSFSNNNSMITQDNYNNLNVSLTQEFMPTQVKEDVSIYNTAYDFMLANNLTIAEAKFSDFLWKHPNSDLAPMATFWLGEINLHKWMNDNLDTNFLNKASNYFQIIISDYHMHAKYKDALLKMGIIEKKKGNVSKAEEYFRKIINLFPNTSAANLANINLKN